jgi:hypothetical protein
MKSGPSVSPPGCVLHVFSEKKSSHAFNDFPHFPNVVFALALPNTKKKNTLLSPIVY